MRTVSSRFLGMPRTRIGWWSVGLAIVFLMLFVLLNAATLPTTHKEAALQPVYLPNLGCPTILCGLVTGFAGLIAITRQQERSWLVWLSLLPGIFSLTLLIVDFVSAILIG